MRKWCLVVPSSFIYHQYQLEICVQEQWDELTFDLVSQRPLVRSSTHEKTREIVPLNQ